MSRNLLNLVLALTLFLMVAQTSVHAQATTEICADEGEFGPTCAATIAPTLPPANTPIPELPKSGSVSTTIMATFGGMVILMTGAGYAFLKR